MSRADQSALGVEDVIITDELDGRLSRAPDHEIENRILTGLAETLASNPENLLQELTDQLVEIGVGESAGISLEESNGDDHIFRWVAVSGEWLPFSGGTMPFAASPCGVVVTRKETLLFRSPERVFPAANVDPLIGEVLLVPFQFDGKPAGTVWAIKHRLDGRFDAEDARMLNVLSRFASAAYRAMKSQAEVRESQERQTFMLELSDALRPLDTPADIAKEAAARLGKWLDLNRVFYGEIAGTKMTVECDYTDGVASIVGEHDMAAFGDFLLAYRPDALIVSEDTQADTRYGEDARAGLLDRQVAAFVDIGLFEAGDCVSLLGAQSATTRQWTAVELGTVRETGGRVKLAIDRARAGAAFRKSERRQGLLLAELQHRVRNILAMVRSVVRRTADSYEDVDDYVRHLDGRLSSLARVQAILTRESGRGVDLHDMVLDELTSQGTLPTQYQIEGPQVELSPKAAEVLGLAVHELATNSTKYGVLSESSGTIRIRWSVHVHHALARLRLTWNEPVNADSDRPARTGFGTDLIENRVPYELRGTGQLLIGDEEVEARIDFPLSNGPSKLEIVATDRDIRQ